MSGNTSDIEKAVRIAVKEFTNIIRETDSIIFPFLRFHLLTENLLERIITCQLAHADSLLDNANLRYHQKLCLVSSFDSLSDKVVQALKNLNSKRNRLSHTRSESISTDDIDKIGRPFGKEYSELRAKYSNDTKELMICVFELIYLDLFTVVHHLESGTISPDKE
jgi:hypothetical protein